MTENDLIEKIVLSEGCAFSIESGEKPRYEILKEERLVVKTLRGRLSKETAQKTIRLLKKLTKATNGITYTKVPAGIKLVVGFSPNRALGSIQKEK